MKFLEWLFNRRRTCEDCSLYERQANALRDELEESREACIALGAGFQEQEQLGEDLLAVSNSLIQERDGLIRELWLERSRTADLRRQLAQKPRVVLTERASSESIHREIRERK